MTSLALATGRDQPRPGLPRHRRSGRGARRRRRGDPPRRQPVPAAARRPRAAPGDRPPPAPLLRPRARPRHRDPRHRRRHRGARRRAARDARHRRRGRRVRADVRQLPGVHRARRRPGRPRAAAARRRRPLPLRPRRAARRDHAAHAADPAQHAAQPDGQGLRRAPSWPRSPRWRSSTTCSSSPTRSTSTSCSPAPRHVPIATLPGHGRAHADDLVGRQDVQHDGLEDRLDVRAGARWCTAAKTAKQFLTYVSGAPFQPAIAAGLDLADEYFAGIAPDLAAKRDRLVGRPAGGRVRRRSCPRRRTSPPSTSGPCSPTATAWRSAARCPTRCGVVGIPNEVFYARTEHGRHLVRFACCKRVDVLDEAADAPGVAA